MDDTPDLADGGRRLLEGLRRLNALARELLEEPSLDLLLVRIADAARDLVSADFSALVLVREDRPAEIAHFAYNAPRELFPDCLPRVVGLLAVPIRTGSVVRLDDIRGHPEGVGIPVEHPPVAALLAAPIVLDGRVVGELVVGNGVDRPGFDDVDEAVICELAAHGAMAVSLATARSAREQADATREELVGVALHNLRTPLTVAKGFLSTIRHHGDRLSPENRERAFEAIERAHDRILTLAEGALLDDPLTETEGPGDGEAIDVAGLLADATSGRDGAGAEVGTGAEGVAIDVAVDPGTPPAFRGDPALARALLAAVVANAVKHSAPGQRVTVRARPEGASVRFDVVDRGPGIPPEEQGRVFEQFYRTTQSRADALPGHGLGLWSARRLAGLHGGTVGLSSRSGQGTTVWVTFPVSPS